MLKPWGIKYNVLLLTLLPAITIALTLDGYFMNLILDELATNLFLLEEKEYKILWHSTLIILFGFIISWLFALLLNKKIITPLKTLAKSIEMVQQGNLDTRILSNSNWEVAILESGFNSMASSLQTAHEKLQKNISQATADLRNTLETIEIQNVELDLARKEAEAASKIKSEFLANMSHEIRTPLNGIIGFINLLQKSDLTDKQKDYINTIQKSANSLLSIINDILDFSKIEAGKMHLDIEPMNIHECIEDTLTLLSPFAHEKNLELVHFIYNDVPIQLMGDSLRIKQVLTNLVNNAIKFTPKGSVIVRVMLENETDTTVSLNISIQDTGIGMSQEQQNKLFEAFNQLDPKITKQFGGSGLGLVICKKLIEQMQGNLSLESKVNEGSTFYFTLTFKKLTSTELVYLEPYVNHRFHGTKILLFDTHDTTRLTIKHLLIKWGFDIHEVINYHDIVNVVKTAYLAKQPFKLAIMGINQPDPTSNFVTNIFNAIRYQYSCPIGVFANTTDHVLINQEILQAGISLCLAKPICRQKLYNALIDVLNFYDQSNNKISAAIASKVHILVVDDNPENLKLARFLLENIGIEVTTANSGTEALILTEATLFNMILMDIHMPILNGITTSLTLRNSESINKNTPIVALSANILLSEKSAISAAKIDDYLTKPISENQLRAAIYKWTQYGTNSTKRLNVNLRNYNKTSSKNLDTSNRLKSIDWKLAQKLAANNQDLARDMLKMIIATLSDEQQHINAAYLAKDKALLHHVVHKLHGACCYTGLPKLKKLLQSLESSIENHAIENLKPYLDQVDTEIFNILELWKNDKLTKEIFETVMA